MKPKTKTKSASTKSKIVGKKRPITKNARTDSKQKIINTALQLFAEQGFNGTSIRQIAAKAKVALGLMYNYFEGKDALLHSIFLEGLNDIKRSYGSANAYAPPADQLRSVITNSLATIHQKHKFYRLFYSLRIQPSILAAPSEELFDWEISISKQLQDIFKALGYSNPTAEAKVFLATMEGIGHQLVLDPKNYPLKEVEEALIRKYTSVTQPSTKPAAKPKASKKPATKGKEDPSNQGQLF